MPDPMTLLKADHKDTKALLKKLADSNKGAAREKMTEKLIDSLKLHMKIEEKLIYPHVKKHVGKEAVDEANIEHALVRKTLGDLSKLVSKPGFGAIVDMLEGGITHHVKEEETEVLPKLNSKMARADWMALGDQIEAAKKAAK